MTGTRLETRRRADPLHLAMADRELDTAYDHLTAARSGADYDAAAYQGDDHDTPPAWLGAGMILVFAAAFLALLYALWKLARAAWGW